MSRGLPLFPLSTVLYPGLVLPLHIFEERYRTLVADLLVQQRDGIAEFGVVAIRHGPEVGANEVPALYQVGCIARVQRVSETGDGRYDIVTTGTDRFRLVELARPAPYLRAEVEALDDPLGDVDDDLAATVRDRFERYLELVSETPLDELLEEIPDDARTLSYLVAATMALPLAERQRLLEVPDAATRLRVELDLLQRENRLIRALGSLPATDFTSGGWSLS